MESITGAGRKVGSKEQGVLGGGQGSCVKRASQRTASNGSKEGDGRAIDVQQIQQSYLKGMIAPLYCLTWDCGQRLTLIEANNITVWASPSISKLDGVVESVIASIQHLKEKVLRMMERQGQTFEGNEALSVSEKVTYYIHAYAAGVKDAISLHSTLLFFVHSRIIRLCTMKCIILNGLIFLGSIFFFDHFVIPLIHLLGDLMIDYRLDSTRWKYLSIMIDWIIVFLYQVLWLYPIYCISFILNTIWYQEIADQGYLLIHGEPCTTGVRELIRDELYRSLLVATLLFQVFVCYIIPIVGPPLSFIMLSWLYSLYHFEYKWSLHGWSLDKRLTYLERNWAFFAGFGSPCTLATFFSQKFVSVGVFALLFPVFLLLAIRSQPIQPPQQLRASKLPVFKYSKWMTNRILLMVGKKTGLRSKRRPQSGKKYTNSHSRYTQGQQLRASSSSANKNTYSDSQGARGRGISTGTFDTGAQYGTTKRPSRGM